MSPQVRRIVATLEVFRWRDRFVVTARARGKMLAKLAIKHGDDLTEYEQYLTPHPKALGSFRAYIIAYQRQERS